MAKVTASSSIGVKLKYFSDYENVNPHASIGIEKELPDDLSDDELLIEGKKLYQKCREFVQTEIEKDIESAKGKKS